VSQQLQREDDFLKEATFISGFIELGQGIWKIVKGIIFISWSFMRLSWKIMDFIYKKGTKKGKRDKNVF
jgi:hypothetical protein